MSKLSDEDIERIARRAFWRHYEIQGQGLLIVLGITLAAALIIRAWNWLGL